MRHQRLLANKVSNATKPITDAIINEPLSKPKADTDISDSAPSKLNVAVNVLGIALNLNDKPNNKKPLANKKFIKINKYS